MRPRQVRRKRRREKLHPAAGEQFSLFWLEKGRRPWWRRLMDKLTGEGTSHGHDTRGPSEGRDKEDT